MFLIYILLFVLSYFTYQVGKKELHAYEKIPTNHQMYLYGFPLFIIIILYTKGLTIFSFFFCLIIPIMISQVIIDLNVQELSDRSSLVILLLGIIRLVLLFIQEGVNKGSFKEVGSYVISGILLFSIYLIIAIVSNGSLGGGDIKLIGAIGIFFSAKYFTTLLIVPIFLGALIALFLLISKKAKKDTSFPFGPAILLSVYLIALFL